MQAEGHLHAAVQEVSDLLEVLLDEPDKGMYSQQGMVASEQGYVIQERYFSNRSANTCAPHARTTPGTTHASGRLTALNP
jgi:hypothetical protein